ncbi:uncharacterized protein LOC131303624 [Rhododendron vialii]|uniref:uncharacterized protein LOC131303624 n=1 Tax=Rhododendron vialii TaxID=182163 RepID=UPI00265FD373|nr:uncharacterized protein LOC131303624 [Rhododendron vialii]
MRNRNHKDPNEDKVLLSGAVPPHSFPILFSISFFIMNASKMLLLSSPPTPLVHLHPHNSPVLPRKNASYAPLKVSCMAKESSETGNGAAAKAAIVGGLVSTPVIGWSLYTLKTTGCGLPPGPGGSIGALEGVSYLAVAGIVGWSLYTKSKTGSGLPNGPFGLLGAVEGLSYLSLLAIVVVFGLQFLQNGSIPGPLPSDQCFG